MSEVSTVDAFVEDLESRGLCWDVGVTHGLRECRIWHWPHVIARYRPHERTPIANMLAAAMYDVDFTYYTKLAPGEEIKPYYRNATN